MYPKISIYIFLEIACMWQVNPIKTESSPHWEVYAWNLLFLHTRQVCCGYGQQLLLIALRMIWVVDACPNCEKCEFKCMLVESLSYVVYLRDIIKWTTSIGCSNTSQGCLIVNTVHLGFLNTYTTFNSSYLQDNPFS